MLLAIIDFEATCWERKEGYFDQSKSKQPEIIEFASVLTDEEFNVVKEFDCFVRPFFNPTLSPFCTKLTTITQCNVDSAKAFPSVLGDFRKWIGSSRDKLFCSWGSYDRRQLESDCARWRNTYPFNDLHLNIKNWFAREMKTKPMGVEKALRYLNMSFQGTHHRGIDDCRNILRIIKEVRRRKGDRLLVSDFLRLD